MLEPIFLLQDNARELLKEDHLGMKAWVDVIAGTSIGNDGPFTIGIYKEWGYGKTTLLRLAQATVDEHAEALGKNAKANKTQNQEIVTVWFNAWQFEREEHPLFPLIAAITDEIDEQIKHEDPEKPSKLKQIGLSLRALTRGMKFKGEVGMPWVGKVGVEFDADKALAAEDILGKQVNPLQGELLYHSAFELLGTTTAGDGKVKIVVFIDDLDRCNPENAVHLLECIKLVLCQKGFIFVLAVDNQVIETYLDKVYEDKYGFKAGTGRGKKYLEKIVQLPLEIPPHEKRFESYVDKLIGELEEKYLENNIRIGALRTVQTILASHVGHNPRRLVRLIDSFLIDTFLWEGTKDLRSDFQALTEDVVNGIAIHRVVHAALGDELTNDIICDHDLREHLVSNQMPEPMMKLSRGVDLSLEVGEETVDPEHVKSLRSRQDLRELLSTKAARKLVDPKTPDLWENIRHFMTTARTDREIEFPEAISSRIRSQLGLQPEEPIRASVLENLTYLPLIGRQITNRDILDIERLTSVTTLELIGTSITDEGLESIGKLTGLNTLIFGDAKITDAGLQYLESLTSLTVVNLSGKDITDEGLKSLEKLSALTHLVLSHTRITDAGLRSLGKLSPLIHLDLSHTRVTGEGLKSLKTVQTLTHLNLSNTAITDEGLRNLEMLTSLKELYLSQTNISGEGLKCLENTATLTTLDLSETGITDQSLSNLESINSLRVLSIERTKISDRGLSSLVKLIRLKMIHMTGTEITHDGRQIFRDALPSCQISYTREKPKKVT